MTVANAIGVPRHAEKALRMTSWSCIIADIGGCGMSCQTKQAPPRDDNLPTVSYRAKWNLLADYPMAAGNYAALTFKNGLGCKSGQRRGRPTTLAGSHCRARCGVDTRCQMAWQRSALFPGAPG